MMWLIIREILFIGAGLLILYLVVRYIRRMLFKTKLEERRDAIEQKLEEIDTTLEQSEELPKAKEVRDYQESKKKINDFIK